MKLGFFDIGASYLIGAAGMLGWRGKQLTWPRRIALQPARASHRLRVRASAEQGHTAAQALLECCCRGKRDELLDFIPDTLLDALLDARRHSIPEGATSISLSLSFTDIVEFVQACGGSGSTTSSYLDTVGSLPQGDGETVISASGVTDVGLEIDSIAHRHLVWGQPVHVTPLSSVTVSPERSVHRFELSYGPQGEDVIITLTMEQQDSLTGQYRSAPRIERVCRLIKAVGESVEYREGDPLPTRPSHRVGPELVVQAQLAALKHKDVEGVWAFASPANQKATGPIERFGRMLQSPAYAPLMGHGQSRSLRKAMYSEGAYYEVVAVQGATGHPVVYLFDVQLESSGWVTTGVQVVSSAPAQMWSEEDYSD